MQTKKQYGKYGQKQKQGEMKNQNNYELVKSNNLPVKSASSAKEIANCIREDAIHALSENLAIKFLSLPLYSFKDLLGRKNYLLLTANKTAKSHASLQELRFILNAEVNVEEEDELVLEKAIFLAYQKIKEPPSSILEFIKSIIFSGYSFDASDIHFTPQEEGIEINYRINGQIVQREELSKNNKIKGQNISLEDYKNLIRQIKIFCRLDLNEHNLAQEGGFCLKFYEKREIRLRASILPSQFGSSLSLRLISSNVISLNEKRPFETYGLSSSMAKELEETLSARSGIVLFCGPTGSGKSTLLSAAIYHLRKQGARIVSLEDPIEKIIPGVTQVEVDPVKKQRYSDFLPTALRQDPDVICIGEIREKLSASLSIEAGLSGHLIISSFHASSTEAAIRRLLSIGVKNESLKEALLLVTNQRLVRLNCQDCIKPVSYPNILNKKLSLKRSSLLFTGQGCEKCSGTGLRERRPVIEIRKGEDIFSNNFSKCSYFEKQIKDLLLEREISPEAALEVLRG